MAMPVPDSAMNVDLALPSISGSFVCRYCAELLLLWRNTLRLTGRVTSLLSCSYIGARDASSAPGQAAGTCCAADANASRCR